MTNLQIMSLIGLILYFVLLLFAVTFDSGFHRNGRACNI